MRFLIYGTGAVGGYLGGRLAEAGHDVLFLARPPMAEAMVRHGLRLEHDGRSRAIRRFEVLTDLPSELPMDGDSAVLLAVRAFDCASAAQSIRGRLTGRPPVICLLNGIGNEDTLAASLGAERVVAATLTTAVTVSEPGVIHVERERGLGLARGAHTGLLAGALRAAGLRLRLYPDAAAMKWSKVPTNIIANASSAALGWTVTEIMRHRGVYRLEVEALRETFRVMRRSGLHPVDLPGVPIRWLARGIFLPPVVSHPWLSRAVIRGRGDRRPSLHRDLGSGRSEVNWLNGAVVEHGERLAVPTPANRVLLTTLLELVESRRGAADGRDRLEQLMDRARREGVPGV